MISQCNHNLRIYTVFLLLFAILSGCGGTPVTSPAGGAAHQESPASRAASVAVQQLGVPYRYGGSDRSGFDCSGLVNYSYAEVGVSMPRTTAGLWKGLAEVERDEIERGDVLFFRIDGKVSHVGLYLGGGKFIHAPQSGRTVSIARLDSDFYRRAYIRAGRKR